MIKKKLLALICVSSMALMLAACGGTEQEKGGAVSETVESADAGNEVSDEESSEEVSVVESEEPEEISKEEEGPEFTLGTTDGNVYENEYLGFRITVPEEMAFASDEELARLSASTGEVLKDNETVKNLLDNGSVMIACYAASDKTKLPINTINLSIQSIASMGLNAKAVENITEEDILDAATDPVVDVFKNSGFTNIDVSMEPVTVLGEKHSSLYITADIENYGKLYEREIVIIKNGYASCFTVSDIGSDSDTTKDLLGYVEKY